MNILLNVMLVAVLVILILLFIVGIRKKLISPTYKDGKGRARVTYFIHFKEVAIPDLSENPAFNEVASIKFKSNDGYSVASTINDVKLRDLLMKEYHLEAKNVIVTHRQMV